MYIGVPNMNQYMSVTRKCPKDSVSFRLGLVHLLLKEVGLRKGMQHSSEGMGRAQSESVLPGECLRRGVGANQCQLTKKRPPRYTCGVRCKTTCFADCRRF